MIDIYSKLEKHSEGIKETIKDYLYHSFMIGKLMKEIESDYIYKDMLENIELDEQVKDIGRNLCNHFDYSVSEFERQLYLSSDNLTQIEINGNKPSIASDNNKGDVLYHLQNWLSTKDDNSRSYLLDTMNRISKIVNVSYNLDDITSITYSYCCGCGTLEIPAEGFHLQEIDGIKFPVCDECRKNDIVDMKKILNLYYVYAINIEKGLNKL